MIRNVHQRVLPVSSVEVGPLLDRVAEPGNPVWPGRTWPPLILDRPLGVGADGGHGPVRYACTGYEPGRRVEFTFAPRFLFQGTHTFEVLDTTKGCLVRHIAVGRSGGLVGLLAWTLAIRWLHDALLEDLLDRIAIAIGHPPARPAQWSPWVRLLRRLVHGDPPRPDQDRRTATATSSPSPTVPTETPSGACASEP